MMDGCCTSPGEERVGTIRGTSQLTDFRGLFPSLPMKTEAKLDLDMLVVFLVAFGALRGGPWGDRWVLYHSKGRTG